MNTESAYKVLGVSNQMDPDEIQDVVENKVFEIKQKILNPPQLPKVLEVQKDRLKRIQKAAETIGVSSVNNNTGEKIEAVTFSGLDLAINYQKYDAQQRSILLKLANARSMPDLLHQVTMLTDLTRAWYLYISEWGQQYPQLTNFDKDITLAKAQEPVSLFKSVKVLQEKYQGVLPEHPKGDEKLQPLVKECMRIIKYNMTYEP